MARYPDGGVVMDEHVTAEHVAELSAEIDRLRAILRDVSGSAAAMPRNRTCYTVPADTIRRVDAAIKAHTEEPEKWL